MSMRITTNGTIYSYKSNLMRSYNTLNDASEKVLTQRNFNSYAEDPAAASQAFQLRRSMWRTEAQLTNSNTVTNKFDTAWSAINDISSDIGNDLASVSALSAISDGSASGRNALGQTLTSAADAVLQSMNVKYGDEFIFAGADGLNVPFSWDDDGNLLYRGLSVDASSGDNYDALQSMAKETTYVDLGLGLSETSGGELITTSAFNSALSGIDFLGYGTDSDGDPKNIVSIMKKLGDIFSNCDTSTGEYASDEDKEIANRLTGKLETALSNLTVKQTELDVQSSSLETNTTRLESLSDTLNEQIVSIEQIDPADAITALSWAQYCYNAALKIGNSILSQSLLDYMN
ncbi:MAG: hypothetical protein EOM14_01000 [Clostridia bacterium]|nr:hypothetical protein [Clostridia bacterium]